MRLLGKTTDFWWKEFVLLKNQDSWKKKRRRREGSFDLFVYQDRIIISPSAMQLVF